MSDKTLTREEVTEILEGYHAGCPCETTPGGFCECYVHGARLLAHDAAQRAEIERLRLVNARSCSCVCHEDGVALVARAEKAERERDEAEQEARRHYDKWEKVAEKVKARAEKYAAALREIAGCSARDCDKPHQDIAAAALKGDHR